MLKSLDLYLIPTRKQRYTLFSQPEALEALEASSGDRIRKFIAWFVRKPNRLVAWVGRVLSTGYSYYVRLEDRIDPIERVLKGMAVADSIVIHFVRIPNGGTIGAELERVLQRQRLKHIIWFSVDIVVSAVVLVFTPFLAPIPGPNVFFYYPFLRLLSHYRAVRGATSGLRSSGLEFKSLPDKSCLEDNPRLAGSLERTDT